MCDTHKTSRRRHAHVTQIYHRTSLYRYANLKHLQQKPNHPKCWTLDKYAQRWGQLPGTWWFPKHGLIRRRVLYWGLLGEHYLWNYHVFCRHSKVSKVNSVSKRLQTAGMLRDALFTRQTRTRPPNSRESLSTIRRSTLTPNTTRPTDCEGAHPCATNTHLRRPLKIIKETILKCTGWVLPPPINSLE